MSATEPVGALSNTARMKSAYLLLRSLAAWSNTFFSFPFTERTRTDIDGCELAVNLLGVGLAKYRNNYAQLEYDLGPAAIQTLKRAAGVVSFFNKGFAVRPILECLKKDERYRFAEIMPRGFPGNEDKRPIAKAFRPNPNLLEALDEAYQTWLSRQHCAQQAYLVTQAAEREAALSKAANALLKAPPAETEPANASPVESDPRPHPPTIWHHGGASYSLDGRSPENVSAEDNNILQAFLGREEAIVTKALEKAGVCNVSVAIGRLAKIFGEDAVQRPRRKNAGYYIRVRTRPKGDVSK